MRSSLKLLASIILGACLFAPGVTEAQTRTSSQPFAPGDVVRGSGPALYYLGSDGHRYVFPNEKTFFTWYPDFSAVRWISDLQLTNLPLGASNITYRPGAKLVKVTTDPRVYAVDRGGILRHVLTEGLAETLYGTNWRNQVEDIPDAMFVNYTEGPPISQASHYIPSDVMTLTTRIDQEKQLSETEVTINIGNASVGFTPPTFSIKQGLIVRWVNTDIRQHQIVGGDGWLSPILNPGQSFERLFPEIGSYTYSDLITRSMEGNLNVIQ